MIKPKKASRMQRKGAKEILRLGQKALSYRKDLLSTEIVQKWEQANLELAKVLKSKPIDGDDLELKAKNVDSILRESGGLYYHKKSWVENVEMLLVAAIVVIGIRSFFVQPFIIPTNSMFPSFYGMQPKIYEDDEKLPNIFERGVDKALLGASHYNLIAENSGELFLKIQNGRTFNYVTGSFPNGRFFLFPRSLRQYIFEVGGKEQELLVPGEFDLDELIARKFAGIEDIRDLPMVVSQDHGFQGNRLKLSSNPLAKDEVILAFDILLGDALFVDRVSYNFFPPKSGDPLVFRTGSIDEYNRKLGVPVHSFIGEDKYYIKRLIGEPGDTLEMRVPDSIFTNGTDVRKGVPGILFRNGNRIKGKEAFVQNGTRVDDLSDDANALNIKGFPGYRAEGLLSNRNKIVVPDRNSSGNETGKKAYFAMGDNSTDSLDGRAWGFVPENEIIGRAFLIYYPFTSRWGFSK